MSNVKLFESKKVRSRWNEDEQKWYFSIIDIVEILTDTENPRRYWSDLKRKLKKEGFIELYDFIVQLRMEASDGKMYLTDCADTEILLRIIQTIPSQKAEPFKRWLAQVGYERLEEIENPEIATKRIRETYKMKGYSDDWLVYILTVNGGICDFNFYAFSSDLSPSLTITHKVAGTTILHIIQYIKLFIYNE